jgi:bifunctional non-homologous end joining protein LigD
MLLGYYDDEARLVYAGKVGTGHQRLEKDLLARFARVGRAMTPFEVALPRGAAMREAHWLEPVLVVEVAFIEWTSDGLRHPTFQGVREDREPRDVRAERPT